jgi:hypothetical protein
MILTIIFTILSAWYDAGERFTNHVPRFVFRAIVVAIISYLSGGNFFANFALNAATFYLLFDYLLNSFEGRKWNYVGNTSEIDKLWRRYGGWITQLIFKVVFLTITFYIHERFN